MEQTLILIKPDGVKRKLSGKILSRFEDKGMKVVAMKMLILSKKEAEKHYAVHKDKPFFNGLVSYIISGPIVAAILEGTNCISITRTLCGSTDGSKAQPGTIRGDFSMGIEKNIIHASDSVESFQYEWPIYFSREEIIEYSSGDEELIF
ncbi:nucleoside-diphosphate kinase [Oxyplasma meridianum]|uniref:Nucleoside diphosphate kinase n=1 Tax=Oxyplasma meridianum TaxID=3073602 RepID=A0AAX4NGU2_9ARCH